MNKIAISDDYILFLAEYNTPEEHCHFAKHLLIGLDEKIHATIHGESVSGRGICISSNVRHTAMTSSGKMIVALIEETSLFSLKLNRLLPTQTYAILQEETIDIILDSYKKEGLPGIQECFMDRFDLMDQDMAQYDARIQEVLKHIQTTERIDEGIFDCLSKRVGLSQSRLSHLFKQQVNISLASYIVLAKMHKAGDYVWMGDDFTTAAHRAGFSSSAHLSSTCKKMFGISLSDFLF